MTKFKKYLAVFAATVLLVSAFAPGLILSAAHGGYGESNTYPTGNGYQTIASASSWCDESPYFAEAIVYSVDGSVYDYSYDADLPDTVGGGTGYSAVAIAYGLFSTNESIASSYWGTTSFGCRC